MYYYQIGSSNSGRAKRVGGLWIHLLGGLDTKYLLGVWIYIVAP